MDNLTDAERLANVNAYWRRMAADVAMDRGAVALLARICHPDSPDEFLHAFSPLPLARLAAARFVTLGQSTVQITPTGQDFIEAIQRAGKGDDDD